MIIIFLVVQPAPAPSFAAPLQSPCIAHGGLVNVYIAYIRDSLLHSVRSCYGGGVVV